VLASLALRSSNAGAAGTAAGAAAFTHCPYRDSKLTSLLWEVGLSCAWPSACISHAGGCLPLNLLAGRPIIKKRSLHTTMVL